MKALGITNSQITKDRLLEKAKNIPGAWIGIRIAVILLRLSGWKSTGIAALFGLSQWSVVKWIQKVNKEGLKGVNNVQRTGRPPRISEACKHDLALALKKPPKECGINRERWDGIAVLKYLKKVHGVTIQVRRSQQLLIELRYNRKKQVNQFARLSKKGDIPADGFKKGKL